MPYYVVKQLTAAAIFHYHVKLLFGFNNLIELNDVWMSDLLENFDFPGDPFNVLLIIDLVLLKNLDGYFFNGKSVLNQFDLSESTLAEMLACNF